MRVLIACEFSGVVRRANPTGGFFATQGVYFAEVVGYTGIDYGLGRTNIDKATGIRFGVVSANTLSQDAFNDCWEGARDLSFEQAQADAKTEIDKLDTVSELAEWIEEHLMLSRGETAISVSRYILDGYTVENDPDTIRVDERAEVTAHIWAELEDRFNDAYAMADCGDRDWLYEQDGYKLTNCLTNVVMVLSSPYFTYAQLCSPCVPGACNLDKPMITPPDGIYGGDGFERDWQRLKNNRCYCLGHDWFEDGRAPYPVYSVETGELVTA